MEEINLVLGLSNTICALLVGALAIPLILKKVKMNSFYGARFQKSFESEENWYKINQKSGQLLLVWSVVLFLLGVSCFLLPKIEGALVWIYGFAPLVYVISTVQCYAYARKL